jgi:hypothetical protein
MAVAYRGVSCGYSENTGVTTMVMTEPTSTPPTYGPGTSAAPQQDDWMLCWIVIPQGATSITLTDWTEVYNHLNGSYNYRVILYRCKRGASAPNLTLSWTGACAWREWTIVAYSGVTSSAPPWTDVPVGDYVDSMTNPVTNPPAITTTVSNCMIVVFGDNSLGANNVTEHTGPSGYTKVLGLARDYSAMSVWQKQLTGTATEDPGTITGDVTGTGGWNAVTVALDPAAGGATFTPRATLLGVG